MANAQESEPKSIEVASGKAHTFVVALEHLRIQIHDEAWQRCARWPYKLVTASGAVETGDTDQHGWIIASIPKGKQKVRVEYTSPKTSALIKLDVLVTDADPSSDEALLSHLRNFGFTHDDDSDEGAVVRFQAAKGLALSGELDSETRRAIEEVAAGGDASIGDSLRPEEE